MTRENLIKAIYDNEEEWSCAYTCPHTMEEENPKEVCWECAEKLLSEYDKQIREHIVNQCIFIVRRNSNNGYRDIDGDWVEPYCNTRDVIDEMEQLKEQNEQNSIIEDLKPRGCVDMPKNIVCNCTKESNK